MTSTQHLQLALIHVLRAKPFPEEVSEREHEMWFKIYAELTDLLHARGCWATDLCEFVQLGLALPLYQHPTDQERQHDPRYTTHDSRP